MERQNVFQSYIGRLTSDEYKQKISELEHKLQKIDFDENIEIISDD